MNTAEKIHALLVTAPETRDRIGEPYPFRNEKRREVTSTWEYGQGSTDPDTQYGEDGVITLDLTTYHYGDRKCLSSTLRVSIRSNDGRMTQTTMAFGARGESVNVLSAACARFSAKAMREHHAAALAKVHELAYECGQQLQQGVEQYLPGVPA